jgi:hypothetical protein
MAEIYGTNTQKDAYDDSVVVVVELPDASVVGVTQVQLQDTGHVWASNGTDWTNLSAPFDKPVLAAASRTRILPVATDALIPSTSNTAVPIAVNNAEGAFRDITIPADVGDVIQVDSSILVKCPSGSGLVLSIWSIAGSAVRDWTSGVTGLQSVAGAFTIWAGNSTSGTYANGQCARATATNTVKETDRDANGNVCFRLYCANEVSGAFAYQLLSARNINNFVAKNLRKNIPGITRVPVPVIKYPGGVAGADSTFTLVANTFTKLDDTGRMDITIPAKVGDLIEADINLYLSSNTIGVYVVSTGGRLIRNWTSGALFNSVDEINDANAFNFNASGVRGFGKQFQRVLPSDLDSKGNVTFKVYVKTTYGGSRTAFGMQSAAFDNLSYISVTNWPYERNFYGLGTVTVEQPGEMVAYVDQNGLWNGFVSHFGGYGGVDWLTSPGPTGPWALRKRAILSGSGNVPDSESSVLFEDKTLYFYYKTGNAIAVAYGPNPSELVKHTALAFDATVEIPGVFTLGTVANQCVCRGLNGIYYLFYESKPISGASVWTLSVARSTSPLGPFKHWQYDLTGLRTIDLAFTATIAGTTMTLNSAVTGTGTFSVDTGITGAGIPAGLKISRLLTGLWGANGSTYQVSASVTVGPIACTSKGTVGHPYVEWNGSYFTMIYHASYRGNEVDNLAYVKATSKDGVAWTQVGKNTLNEVIPLIHSVPEHYGRGDCGNPWVVRKGGKSYIFIGQSTTPIGQPFGFAISGTQVVSSDVYPAI